MEVVLTYPTPDGTARIDVAEGKVSLGRGSDADHRIADDGLSRLNSTIYREAGSVWIVDENSTNGTVVNGEPARPSGTPLNDGDVIRIGNYTKLMVSIQQSKVAPAPVASPKPTGGVAVSTSTSTSAAATGIGLLPVIAIAFAIFLIVVSVAFVGFRLLVKDEPVVVRTDRRDTFDDDEPIAEKSPKPEDPKPKNSNQASGSTANSSSTNSAAPDNISVTSSVDVKKPDAVVLGSRKYLALSETEKRQYIESRAQKVAAMIGNRSSGDIPTLAIDRIKGFLDGYAKRANVGKLGGCRFGDNLQVTYERASKNAPFIIQAFNQEFVDPQIGLYLAMIESEHCVCLQSPTKPLGMFQFTKATGEAYGLRVIPNASPSNPDERCEPAPAARAAAKYMKYLLGRYGTGPSSVPLAIGSYNSGEGGLSKNLKTALESQDGLPRDFWSLIANGDKLSEQFQSENFKYVPKFFAAAIVGENPADFGLSLQPLSTYTK